ncbi:MAG: YggT family protein [Candidatus Omnitrophica bacterium]|nr:YggT family protein [Candidatus Omnitrophota bacterium]
MLAYIVQGLAIAVAAGLHLLYWLILLRCIVSWVNPDPLSPVVYFLRRATDPFLEPVSRILMPLTLRLRVDISSLLVFFVIIFLQGSLVNLLFELADRLKQ